MKWKNIVITSAILLLWLTALMSCTTADGEKTDKEQQIQTENQRPSSPIGSDPHEFSIGNAVSPIHYYMTAWILNDLFKAAGFEDNIGEVRPSRMWVPQLDFQWKNGWHHLVQSDELGWPTSLELINGQRAEQLNTLLMATEATGVFPAGDYILQWEGEGKFTVSGAEWIDTENPKRAILRYPDKGGAVILGIVSTDPENNGDYLRNIKLYRPDAVNSPESDFNQEYLEYLRPYSVIRPMHMWGEQAIYGPGYSWEDRKPYGYSHWGAVWESPMRSLLIWPMNRTAISG